MDSKRLTILKAITAQLETITITNGYQHELTGKVFRGRQGYGAETQVPYVGLFEVRPEDMPDRADETIGKDVWVIGVQGTVKAHPDHPTDPAHNLMADIKMALGGIMTRGGPGMRNPNYMFGDLIVDMVIDGGITFVPVESPELALSVNKLVITLSENMENPYE